jgi:energy-coupling factor transport system substrate-specific component
VSWQLGAFALLAIALGAGFAWYERVRPDTRIVALVGTLAAFAALGRIAFAAVPNVKPTTDIVLISGYALGGGPGFAVGALAGLTSNFFFGQGPWTPWQMAAWGATGVLGAALARLTEPPLRSAPRAIGRWPLAVVCFVAGFAFTAIQDVGDWVTYSDHSSAQLGIYVGKGLGFDAIHAVGCLAFAVALGPALTRSIQRFARRLQVTWLPPSQAAASLVGVLLLATLAAGLGAPVRARAAGTRAADAPAGGPRAAAARSARTPLSYLLGSENRDGGFGAAPGQVSSQLYTGWAALGLASARYDLAHVARGSGSLLGYVRAGSGSLADVGSLERTILVVRAAGLSARSFGGRDLVAMLRGHVQGDGAVSGQVNLTAFAVLALRSAGQAPRSRTVTWLERQQDRDGGFSFAGAGSQSDVDDTGAALEALANVGGAGSALARRRAVAYLRRQQNRDGGFGSQPGSGSNAQSTAWGIQGLDAAHISPLSLRRGGAVTPLAYLRGLIAPNGSVRYARGIDQTPVWVTGEALMALEGQPLPLVPESAAAAPVRSVSGTRPSASSHTAAARRTRSGSSAPRRHPARRARPVTGPSAGAVSDPILGLAAGAGLATAFVFALMDLG